MKTLIILSICVTLAASASFRAASMMQASMTQTNWSSADIDTILGQRITVPASTNITAQVAALTLAPTQVARIAILDQDSDYVFDFSDPSAGETIGDGGHTVAAHRGTFPGVVGNGVAMTVGFIAPCGLNTPHTHPRATEINYAVNGTFLSGFIAENGVRVVQNTLYAGQAAVFPAGAIHWEANLECDAVTFVAAFNHEDPGVLQVAQKFYEIDPAILSATLGGVTEASITQMAAGIPDNVANGIKACRVRCGFEEQY